MKPSTRARRSGVRSSSTSDALLDAAEALMLDQGYAAVSSRRVAEKAGMDAALVYYYFGTMDDLFVALYRRNAQRRAEDFSAAVTSQQPLWALWDTMQDAASTTLMTEFIALGNHRKAVKRVMVQSARKFRHVQLDRLGDVLERYGLDPESWPPAALVVLLSGISWFVRTDAAFGVHLGAEEVIALVERNIRALEGDRAETAPGQVSTR